MFNKMWPMAKSSLSQSSGILRTKDNLSEELHTETRSAAPGARLSYTLRMSLERLDKSERAKIVSVTKADGCAPLFIASKKGNLEIVEYLINVCNADMEQIGIFEVLEERQTHRVTALWAASVSGRLNVVKCLVQHGANVNSVSDSGSSAVRSACFMTHVDIVKYLVEEAHADIQLPNYNGGTCLINSVQSCELCEFLLAHGAEVNAKDIQLKTALHYAIQEHRLETTKLLLKYGADPFLRNRYGDEPLQTAALKGATSIFNYLLENVEGYSAKHKAEMLELMGSTFIDDHHDIQLALKYWRRSLDLRLTAGVEKDDLGYTPLYSLLEEGTEGAVVQVKEFKTHAELDQISTHVELMRINSLLMAERILGSAHKDVIFRIMYRGAAYADVQLYPLCISLWVYVLELRIKKDSILYADSCFTALALIRLYLDLDRSRDYYERHVNRRYAHDLAPLSFDALIRTYDLLIEQIPEASRLIQIRPQYKRQLESYDRCIRCCTHLLYFLCKVAETPAQHYQVKMSTQRIVSYAPRLSSTGDTLLHTAVSKSNVVRSHFFAEDRQFSVFPNFEVAKFLVFCGANVNALNDARASPLHILVSHEDYNAKIAQFLVDSGAHIDQLDRANKSPLGQLLATPYTGFLPLSHISLKCLSAKAIGTSGIPYSPKELPRELAEFLKLHLPMPPVGDHDESLLRIFRPNIIG